MMKRWSIAGVTALALLGLVASTVGAGDVGSSEPVPMSVLDADTAEAVRGMFAERPSLSNIASVAQRVQMPRAGYKPQPARTFAQGTSEVMIEDFEVGQLDPLKWILVYDINGRNYGEYFWSLEQCHASPHMGGIQSLWAIGGGQQGSSHACDDPYPRGVRSSALLDLDLSGYPEDVATLDFVFDFFLNVRNFQEEGIVPDGLFIVLYPDRTDLDAPVVIDGVTATKPEGFFINPLMYDLTNICNDYDPEDCYNVAGKQIMIEFLFVTQMAQGTRVPGGAFIDNVRLVTSNNDFLAGRPGLPSLDLVRGWNR